MKNNLYFNIFRALRIYQWPKNVLVLVPLLTSLEFLKLEKLLQGINIFFSFSLCASAVYIINDIIDLKADQQHPQKKHRPFASGALPIKIGYFLIPLLLVCSFWLTYRVSIHTFCILIIYFVTTNIYSFYFKKIAVLDIICLASLFTLRIIFGLVGLEITFSPWLLAFSMFMFFSLACIKRCAELRRWQNDEEKELAGRGYRGSDYLLILLFGITSGYISILVLALYISSSAIVI
jgi:4-hydroxybenzoate polyprenyltransferase